MRPYTYWTEQDAECQDCGKRWQTKNAQAVAARHHDSTGHRVAVNIQTYICYGDTKGRKKDTP